MNQIEIYQTKDNETQIEVTFEDDTVWLSQEQITTLFERDRTVITKHINNIFKEGELEMKSNVQKMHIANSDKPVTFYNLDVIISVGYRISSRRGTQFRIWATKQLKNYLLKGFALNQQRLQNNLIELQQAIALIQKSSNNQELSVSEARGLLNILSNYTQSFILLNKYDSQTLEQNGLDENITYEIKYEDALKTISELKKQLILKKEASNLFGNQKDKSFEGILKSVIQTFDGSYLYPSIEEQAGHLLYFVIKNHPFSDGNKRIGAFLFVWFLEKNKHRFKKTGELKINDNALTAIALLVAQSNPDDKEMIVRLIVNLIKN